MDERFTPGELEAAPEKARGVRAFWGWLTSVGRAKERQPISGAELRLARATVYFTSSTSLTLKSSVISHLFNIINHVSNLFKNSDSRLTVRNDRNLQMCRVITRIIYPGFSI